MERQDLLQQRLIRRYERLLRDEVVRAARLPGRAGMAATQRFGRDAGATIAAARKAAGVARRPQPGRD